MSLFNTYLEAVQKETQSKSEFTKMFKDEYLSKISKTDKPAIREAWNNLIDSYIKDGQLPEKAGDWSCPFGK